MRTLVIGDVHGHLDRLEALLVQEGVVHNDERVNHEIEVIQLGDLGHFGGSSGTPSGDGLCYAAALDGWIDLLLWGNHDRAVVDSIHAFSGYQKPDPEIIHIMKILESVGTLRMCAARHGFFISHAGLHAGFKDQDVGDVDKDDPIAVATYINNLEKQERPGLNSAIWDAVGRSRGGPSPYGGILWRDFEEKLWRGFPQVFGHSASRKHNVRKDGHSWCIDIGGKGGHYDPDGNTLAGIWLPEQEIVQVNLDG